MATKISSDISTNVDITARKNDSFFIQATVTNEDATAFDLSSYGTIDLSIKNNNNTEVKRFKKEGAVSDTTEVVKNATITDNTTGGVITINVPSVSVGAGSATFNNMNIQVGTYTYTCKIVSATETHTILHGKFKVLD